MIFIKSKQEGDVASGMIECLNKTGKKPQWIYTDDEQGGDTIVFEGWEHTTT